MELVIKPFEALDIKELYELLRVRVSVFVVEQTCPYQEIDGLDARAWHLFYREHGQILAYLRVVIPCVPCNQAAIGRVLTIDRGRGLGKKLMEEGIRLVREKGLGSSIGIEAQTYAKGFYEQLGFRQTSEEFLEDGIPHIKMQLDL